MDAVPGVLGGVSVATGFAISLVSDFAILISM
jgi:hypothetical protein